jgi:hypothetical protein
MNRVPTLQLLHYPRRVALMVAAAGAAAIVDFVSKEIVVAVEPDALLFNVLGTFTTAPASLVLVPAACSFLACVLPARTVALGAGLALGGALGNLASRPRWWDSHGGTPDFIPFADGTTGNVADLFIVAGIMTMLAGVLVWLATGVLADARSRRS